MSRIGDIAASRTYQKTGRRPTPIAKTIEKQRVTGTCSQCGKHASCEMKSFTRRWTNPICILGVFGGLILAVILALILSVYHKIDVPYCADCIDSYEKARKTMNAGRIGLVLTIPFIFVELALIGIVAVSILFFIASIITTIVGSLQIYSRSPKYKATKREYVDVLYSNGTLMRFDKA